MDINSLVSNPEQVKQLIAVLQALLPKEDTTDSETEPTPAPIRSKKINAKDNARENKFLTMPEMNMHKEDTLIDKKLSKHSPVARAREYTPVSVRCRVCGKDSVVNPSLVDSVDRYKCNKCSVSAG